MSDWCEFLLLCGYGFKCTDGIDYRSTVKYRDVVTFRGVLAIPNVHFGMMSIGNTDNYTVFSIFSYIKSTFMWFEIHFMRCVVGCMFILTFVAVTNIGDVILNSMC